MEIPDGTAAVCAEMAKKVTGFNREGWPPEHPGTSQKTCALALLPRLRSDGLDSGKTWKFGHGILRDVVAFLLGEEKYEE